MSITCSSIQSRPSWRKAPRAGEVAEREVGKPIGEVMDMPGVEKRTFTTANILKTIANCAIAFPNTIRSTFRPRTSKALREKVMLGVTAINDCRYCAWGHSHWAISQGLSMDEVNQILSGQNDALKANDPAEAAAILFGQSYAEHLDEIDPDAVKVLRTYFSQAQVREIVGYVYFITFTNLSGNTVDVLLDRLRGKGRPITVIEAVAGAVLAPILFLLVLLVKSGKVVGTDKRRAKRHRRTDPVSWKEESDVCEIQNMARRHAEVEAGAGRRGGVDQRGSIAG